MTNGHDEHLKRWTAKRRAALVLAILRGDTSAGSRPQTWPDRLAGIEGWKDHFLAGAENALCSRPLDDEAQKDQEIKRLKQKVGKLVMDVDILKEATKGNPLRRQMRDA